MTPEVWMGTPAQPGAAPPSERASGSPSPVGSHCTGAEDDSAASEAWQSPVLETEVETQLPCARTFTRYVPERRAQLMALAQEEPEEEDPIDVPSRAAIAGGLVKPRHASP